MGKTIICASTERARETEWERKKNDVIITRRPTMILGIYFNSNIAGALIFSLRMTQTAAAFFLGSLVVNATRICRTHVFAICDWSPLYCRITGSGESVRTNRTNTHWLHVHTLFSPKKRRVFFRSSLVFIIFSYYEIIFFRLVSYICVRLWH